MSPELSTSGPETLASAPSCATDAAREDARLGALARYDILDTPSEEAFDRITRLAQKIFRSPIVTVSLIDGHRQWFKSRRGLDLRETPRGPAFCNVTIAREAPLVVPDAAKDPRFADNPFVTGPPHLRFYAGAPLRSADGHMLGALCVMDRSPRAFDDDDTAILVDLAQIVVDELELRQLASVDALTGALSRRAFRDQAERALQLAARHRHELSVIAIDLDHFKTVNDTFGHGFGDAVLTRSVAACLGELRTSDVMGRLGGEEFAVVLPHTGRGAALEVAERLRAAIAREIHEAEATTVSVTASLGVAVRAEDHSDVEALMRAADAALYRAKAEGRNRCVISEPPGRDMGPPRRRVFKGGRILFNRRMSSLACTIRSLSDAGAGLDVSSSAGLPDTFELSIEADQVMRNCRLVTTSGSRLEVEFA